MLLCRRKIPVLFDLFSLLCLFDLFHQFFLRCCGWATFYYCVPIWLDFFVFWCYSSLSSLTFNIPTSTANLFQKFIYRLTDISFTIKHCSVRHGGHTTWIESMKGFNVISWKLYEHLMYVQFRLCLQWVVFTSLDFLNITSFFDFIFTCFAQVFSFAYCAISYLLHTLRGLVLCKYVFFTICVSILVICIVVRELAPFHFNVL